MLKGNAMEPYLLLNNMAWKACGPEAVWSTPTFLRRNSLVSHWLDQHNDNKTIGQSNMLTGRAYNTLCFLYIFYWCWSCGRRLADADFLIQFMRFPLARTTCWSKTIGSNNMLSGHAYNTLRICVKYVHFNALRWTPVDAWSTPTFWWNALLFHRLEQHVDQTSHWLEQPF